MEFLDGPEFAHQHCAKCKEMALCELEYGLCEDCVDAAESWTDDCAIDDRKERSW